MTTKALRTTPNAKIVRRLREETCPATKLMREAASCWRLLQAGDVDRRIRRLPPRDRSEITDLGVRQRLYSRLRSIEMMASEAQPTSPIGAAYRLLLVTNLTTLDDEIDATCGKDVSGTKERMREKVQVAQKTATGAYHALRRLVSDPDLDVVDRPHGLNEWLPNLTVSALLAAETRAMPEAAPHRAQTS